MTINKNFLYLTLSAFFLLLLYLTSFANANQTNSDFYQNQKNCVNQGGAWRQFSNNCAGNCFSKLEKFSICGQALTFGCDCGSDYCWNKDKCVKDADYQEEIRKNAEKVNFNNKKSQEKTGKEKKLENKDSKIEDIAEQGKNLRRDIMANIVNDSMERAKSIYDSDNDGQEKIKKEIEKRNIKAKNFQQNTESSNAEDIDEGKKNNSDAKSGFGSMFASNKKQEIKHSQGNNLKDVYESLNLYQDNKNNNNNKDRSVIDNIFNNSKESAEIDKKNQDNNKTNDNKGLFSFLFDKDNAKKEAEKMDIPLPVATNQNDKDQKNKENDNKKTSDKEKSRIINDNKPNIDNKIANDNNKSLSKTDDKNPPKLEDFVIPN